MLKRKIYTQLQKWKEVSASKKALCILGARQVGKSTIAREFGKANYSQVIELNFIEDPDSKTIFRNRNRSEILMSLTAYTHQSIIPDDTLIILDEIQECPEARTSIKFLVEDGRAHYIETGSLLGLHYRNIKSYPVGFEQLINMYPMDFEEFLWANSLPSETISYLRTCYEMKETVNQSIHQQLLKAFYTYMIVGGMPEAVQSFVNRKDLSLVTEIQKNILRLYQDDITQYSTASESLKITKIFRAIPGQLDSKNNRFKLNSLGGQQRMDRLENSFLWLQEAGVALPCYNVNAPITPLKLNESRSLFKLFMLDSGLLCAASLESIQYAILNGDIEINYGSILENVFAQSIASLDLDLFYFNSKKIGELDFVIQNGKGIDIFEIKSGASYKKHAALNNAINTSDWKFKNKFVFCKGNVFVDGLITYLPLYMIMFYKPDLPEQAAVDLDLSMLMPPEV